MPTGFDMRSVFFDKGNEFHAAVYGAAYAAGWPWKPYWTGIAARKNNAQVAVQFGDAWGLMISDVPDRHLVAPLAAAR